jgi:1,4-alpha-glucan branching enzyme
MIVKQPCDKPNRILVTFQVPSSVWAESIHLVGDFNGWNRYSHPMIRSRGDDGVWQVTIELDQGKTYQFRYLINGRDWQNDWNADHYAPNPFGGDNSVLET